ncbi:calcium-binding protein [Patulibacter defluvii]|uniref:calcium-binding protein n=1 Tax=Patulibacter defluvii TaxID=3095358 RepID=UPI002A755F5F|nr:calcium-binding protein [Patulibacter sp. DM4]
MTTASHRPRRVLIGALTTVAVLAAAGPAGAAGFSHDGDALVYTAAPGATNWVHVEGARDPGTLLISDSGDRLEPGAGCVRPDPEDETLVACPVPARLRLVLGDGNDRNTLRETLPAIPIEVQGGAGDDALAANEDVDNHVLLDGGEGNDALDGFRFADVLLGGPGNDRLDGRGGDDVLRGGEGDDQLHPDTNVGVVGNDVVDGGPGYDSALDWHANTTDPAFAISITLDGVANDGRPGEADDVISIERFDCCSPPGTYVLGESDDAIDLPGYGTSRVEGRGGNDTLTGNDGTETIDGGAGDDRIEGGYGHDTLTGGPGRDTIYGDETSQRCSYLSNCTVVPFGNDTIYARDGERDVIDCGVGSDRAIVDPIDVVANCEQVERAAAPAARCRPGRVAGLTLRAARSRAAKGGCRVTVARARVRSRKIARGRVVKATVKGRTATLVLSRGRR